MIDIHYAYLMCWVCVTLTIHPLLPRARIASSRIDRKLEDCSNCKEAEGKREAFRFRWMKMQEDNKEQVRGWERDNEGVVTIEWWWFGTRKDENHRKYPNLGSVGIPTAIRFLSSCSPLSLRLPRHRAHCVPALPVKSPRRFFFLASLCIPRVLLHKRLGINVGFDQDSGWDSMCVVHFLLSIASSSLSGFRKHWFTAHCSYIIMICFP
jgi:hypothetical protein